jgi:hypothetical protein
VVDVAFLQGADKDALKKKETAERDEPAKKVRHYIYCYA